MAEAIKSLFLLIAIAVVSLLCLMAFVGTVAFSWDVGHAIASAAFGLQ